MRKLIGLGLAAVLFSGSAIAGETYVSNEILVKYRTGTRHNRMFMENLYGRVGVTKIKRLTKAGSALGRVEKLTVSTDVETAVKELEQNPAVEFVQPNYVIHALNDQKGAEVLQFPFPWNPPVAPDPELKDKPEAGSKEADPEMDRVYGLKKISAPEAWEKTMGSEKVVVAIIDTGVDYNHEDLRANMWENPNAESDITKASKEGVVGWDFVNDDALPFDDGDHGTHVAGIIGAVGNNGIGISGVNQKVSIMALKFLDAEGSGVTSDAVAAIGYAVEHGAKIINASWGAYSMGENKALREAIVGSKNAGLLFVAAAGNEANDNDKMGIFPSGFQIDNIISVAATDEKDELALFSGEGGSNWGKTTVHLAAPGKNIYSTIPKNKYVSFSGTSMATPYVAGAAALLLSDDKSLTYTELKRRLLGSVDVLSSLEGKTITGGRLNVAKALKFR